MANQTLTTGTLLSPINFDSATLSGLANGETITLNAGHLIINGDTRWGSNAAVVDSMTISATLGGSIKLDGTTVWEVPFSASSGNVPAVNDAGSNAITGTGITGELFRVWATGSLTPSASGGAMPATGWVKLRSKTGTFSNGLVVTLPGGATITCSGAGKRSWIHVVAEEGGTITVPRLGLFQTRGDWFELGTTNGADDQTFQFPVADNCPAIQVETGSGTGVYEWWLNAGSRWGTATVYVSQDARGKYFGMDNATGIITIARRASNGCGFKPPTGCRVRIPNIILSNSNSTNYALNTIHATPGTRYDFTTTAAGIVDMEYISCNWYLSLTNTFRIKLIYSNVLQTLAISNIADTVEFDDVGLGLNSTTEFAPISITNCFTSVTLNKVRAVRYAGGASGNVTLTITDVANYTETDCQMEIFGSTSAVTRGNANVMSRVFTRLVGTNTITRPRVIGGFVNLATCSNVSLKDVQYADALNGTTTTTNAVTAISINTGCIQIKVDGFANFAAIANMHPRTGVIIIATGSQYVDIRNIGTAAVPYNCGSANATVTAIAASVMVGLQIRRCYFDNVSTAVLSIANTVQDIIIDNCWGDAADSQALAGVNLTARGCRWTNSTTGQSSVYGRHWEDAFTSTTAGRLLISCNEALAATSSQVEIVTGTPGFTSAGQVAMPTLNDEVIWTMPYFMLGVTSFTNSNPTVTGTGATFVSGNNWTNFLLEFQWDTGSGFNGTWLAFNGATLNGIGAINPSTGVKLKVRARTSVAATTNALTYIRIDTTTNSTDQRIQYPLPKTQLSITGFETNSDVIIYSTADPTGDGSNVLATGDAVSGTFVYEYEGTLSIKIGVFKGGFVPMVTPVINLTSSNANYTVQQRVDRNYL